MIPRHRPPFGIGKLIRCWLRSLISATEVREIEQQYSQHLDIPFAVWLPSARYGITRVIQHATTSGATVFCPAFNCGAVHHAVAESQRTISFMDCGADQFLMDCGMAGENGSAVVLSEMFGHRFSVEQLNQPALTGASVRVFDLAMGIPDHQDMQRMCSDDVTVLSFGLGKSLYAGWGGLALTHSAEVASMLQRRRDEDIRHTMLASRTKHNLQLLARTVAHEAVLYSWLRRRQQNRNVTAHQFSATSHEWNRGATKLHVALSLQNLKASRSWSDQRRSLRQIYESQLTNHPVIRCPKTADHGLSHFSVRVPAVARDLLCRQMRSAGIDVATLFPFPDHLCDRALYPHASRAADEVVNLPLSNQLRQNDVQRICEVLRQCADPVRTSAAMERESESAVLSFQG